MASEYPNFNDKSIDPGLPPVTPPSGRFIAQLFLIPGLIVTVLVLIWLAGTYLVAEKRSQEYFLTNLDSPNEDIRWRTASDLAQVLKRPESLELASNPIFALDLAERLQTNLSALRDEEQKTFERIKGMKEEEKQKEWQKLERKRNHVLFLISALGAFTIPVGVPELTGIAIAENSSDISENTLRRRQAVWALSNLGQNLGRFKELPEPKQTEAIILLKEQVEKPGPRGGWAKLAHDYLANKTPLGVDAALAKCANSEDTFLRALVAHALNFWTGPLVEPTLLRLAHDDGHGTRLGTRVDFQSVN